MRQLDGLEHPCVKQIFKKSPAKKGNNLWLQIFFWNLTDYRFFTESINTKETPQNRRMGDQINRNF